MEPHPSDHPAKKRSRKKVVPAAVIPDVEPQPVEEPGPQLSEPVPQPEFEETEPETQAQPEPEEPEPQPTAPKKRARKATSTETVTCEDPATTQAVVTEDSKKRGRKPKGGKIIQQLVPACSLAEPKPNIILHLRCSLRDLTAIQVEPVESYDLGTKAAMTFDNVPAPPFDTKMSSMGAENSDSDDGASAITQFRCAENAKEIWRKLKVLEHNLHFNNLCDKKSACFWCTYNFQNPAVHIPKHFLNGSYHVYGCFCSPECATAYLMEENLDSSTRFERYYLLNHVYKKVYDYNKNIKPAPNPYYTLDKFYGNLNIHEYRALLRNERLFLVVDKPLTKIMPELHEENEDMMMHNKIMPTAAAPPKKAPPKKAFSKLTVLSEKFGLQG